MGWMRKHDESSDSSSFGEISEFFENSNPRSGDRCATRRVVKSQCRTEEVEPGKFVRKCDKTEQIFKDCVGRPSEVVQSNEEYTEEEVTEQMMKGSFHMDSIELGPFKFPGPRCDVETIERSFFGGLSRFFEAADEMTNGFFSVFGAPHIFDGDSSSSTPNRRGTPTERHAPEEASPKMNNADGAVNISGLARDV
ncbi:unnamed protein product [Ilex paraguariensis]|uniref:Uncharacterized protein n=1 Tax=Ilex paraguariensis TaxID=185542 RepID=A0ABC8SUX2_9AQUA